MFYNFYGGEKMITMFMILWINNNCVMKLVGQWPDTMYKLAAPSKSNFHYQYS